jgi:4-amino-4-deoxy-L-arabinose transferase-like glycosyltransferase
MTVFSRIGARWLAAPLALAFIALYVAGLAGVPFHPDESTYLYMSRDFETLFLRRDPGALAWAPGQRLTPEVRYRLLDAPLHRYLIGLGWWLGGYSSSDLNADWAWDKSWQENLSEGRLPSGGLLQAGRLPTAVLGALAVALIYALGLEVRGPGAAWPAALIAGLSPLALLHARRAMAEGPLLFTSALAVLGGLGLARFADSRPAFNGRRLAVAGLGAGALVGLAVASKHSAAILGVVVAAPVGLALWQKPWPASRRLAAVALAWVSLGVAAAGVFFFLNPVLFRAPLDAARTMLSLRSQLLAEQTRVIGQLAQPQLLPTAADRLRAAVLALYLSPPAVWDVPIANHLGYLEPQAEAYFAQPLHRSWPALGLAVLGLAVGGAAFSALRLARDRLGTATRAEQVVWVWALAVGAFTLVAIPLDWQRYFLPLLPPASLLAGLGLEAVAAPLLRRRRPQVPTVAYDHPH